MSNPYLGEIRPFAGIFAPCDWHFCDGSLLDIATNQPLFALLGTAFGGDGETSFALPDLRGRIPIGQGQGPGLTDRAIGQQSGSETVTLTIDQLPAHSHAVTVTSSAATSPQPGGNVPATPANGAAFYLPPDVGTQVDAPLATDTLQSAGGGQAHENRMPTAAISFIISLTGAVPQPD
ncbi:phage tail protein [Nostoc sp. 3335mG]|nr:phage tail protein [Nostoc sp. 3335mG]